MNQVDRSSRVNDDEPQARKVKSISPHFKPSTCRLKNSPAPISLKKLVSLKAKGTVSHQASTTLNCLTPAASLGAVPMKEYDDKSNASSVLNYSNNFGAFAKIKPLATLVGRVPDNQAQKVSSKTSLSNSIDGITENIPETLILGPRITSIRQPDSEIDRKVKVNTNQSTSNTMEVATKGPLKIVPTKCFLSTFNQEQSPISSCNKNSDLDKCKDEQVFRQIVHKRTLTEGQDPAKATNVFNIKVGNRSQIPSPNRSEHPNLENFTCYAAKGGSSIDPASPNRLMSPKSKKANLNNSGHLLDLVDHNDGFDLEILSIAEQQANSSDSQKNKEDQEKKKMTKIFNFDKCTVNGARLVRRSVDCGKAQSAIPAFEDPVSPTFDPFDNSGVPSFQRCVSGYDKNTQKRVTSKPIPVNFDRLKIISKELRINKLNDRVCKTIIQPNLQFIEDL